MQQGEWDGSNRGRDFGIKESTADKANRAGRACKASRAAGAKILEPDYSSVGAKILDMAVWTCESRS